MRRDYYAVLGVASAASSTQIRRAYQRLARQYSPDVNLWEQNADTLFREVAEAYRVLSDPASRALYDRGSGSGEPSAPADGRVPRASARRGEDAHVAVELSFQQAISGLAMDVPVGRLSACETCDAAGAAPGSALGPCGHCGGLGKVWSGEGVPRADACPACGGTGASPQNACPACRGRGVRASRSTVYVVLPPGMDTGSQIRVAGEGHAGPFGGPRGDLIVIARVHEDPSFTRKGDNLYCEIAISIVEAVLGARVSVRGIDGELQVALPPGTQSGQVFKVRSRGVPKLSGGGRGDLYVTARVDVPRGLAARTLELFRELGRLLPPTVRTPARSDRP